VPLVADERGELEALLSQARAEGRTQLYESEALSVATALGIDVPRHVVVPDAGAARRLDLSSFPGRRVVVKVLSPDLAHKTEVGGVAACEREGAALARTIEEMLARLDGAQVHGFLVAEWVPHDTEAGGELLLGIRWSREFGPLVTLGLGGVTAERLASAMTPDEQPSIFSPALVGTGAVRRELDRHVLGELATGRLRQRAGRADLDAVEGLVRRALEFADWAVPAPIAEVEFNPVTFVAGRPIALDALVRLGDPPAATRPPRPLERAQRLLRPQSVAVMGVSSRGMNPGRIIVRNTLALGFPAEAMRIVKPGEVEIDGVACVGDLGSLPSPVDMLVMAVPAPDVPAALQQVVDGHLAEGVVIVTSGIGEREGSEGLSTALRETLTRARSDPAWSGPVVNGANCLGLRSLPGRVDTLFIPHEKLPLPSGPPAPLALVSQSGAFAIARLSRMPWLSPRAVVTLGNQLDLTIADWMDALASDPEVRVLAAYVEGFPTLEGARFARRVAELTAQGRLVLL
jgi:acyl-CoA synthetase (NDP forming)